MGIIWPSLGVGFITSFSLAIAIGAQNAFILRQGLKREHVFKIALFCSLSDFFLMACGVYFLSGIGKIAPYLLPVMKWGGCIFLFAYGIRSFIRATHTEYLVPADGTAEPMGLKILFLQLFAFTWLNPHVYLDTVLLLGSIAQTQPLHGKFSFLIGTAGGSVVWFFLLAYGARILTPLFQRPVAWKILDFGIGVTMCALATSLLFKS